MSKCLHVATISHQLQGIPLTSAQGAPVTLCQSPTNQNSQYRMQGKTDKKSKQYAKQGSAKAETNWVNNVQLVSAKLPIVVQLLKTPGRQCCQSTSCRSTGAVLCNSVSSVHIQCIQWDNCSIPAFSVSEESSTVKMERGRRG